MDDTWRMRHQSNDENLCVWCISLLYHKNSTLKYFIKSDCNKNIRIPSYRHSAYFSLYFSVYTCKNVSLNKYKVSIYPTCFSPVCCYKQKSLVHDDNETYWTDWKQLRTVNSTLLFNTLSINSTKYWKLSKRLFVYDIVVLLMIVTLYTVKTL